jgi:methylmalonyl-CoA/ethylmalonyl-CoA epimerase
MLSRPGVDAVKLVQIAQHAEDLDRAARFYTELLGAGPVARYDPPGLVFFDLGGVRLLLDRAAPSALLYFPVPDIAAAIERLQAGGAVLDSEPHVIFTHEDSTLGPAGADEWMAFVRDPEDNLVGLVEHRQRT